jgi:hypothetical protein
MPEKSLALSPRQHHLERMLGEDSNEIELQMPDVAFSKRKLQEHERLERILKLNHYDIDAENEQLRQKYQDKISNIKNGFPFITGSKVNILNTEYTEIEKRRDLQKVKTRLKHEQMNNINPRKYMEEYEVCSEKKGNRQQRKELLRVKVAQEEAERQKVSDSDDEDALFKLITNYISPDIQSHVANAFANHASLDKNLIGTKRTETKR